MKTLTIGILAATTLLLGTVACSDDDSFTRPAPDSNGSPQGALEQADTAPAPTTTESNTAISNPPSDCLKFRVIPQLNSPTAGCAPAGSSVDIIGGPTTGDGYQWWEVSSSDGRGWARAEFLINQ